PALDIGAERLGVENAEVVLRFDRSKTFAAYVALVGGLQRGARTTAQAAECGGLLQDRRHVRSPLKIRKASRTGGFEIPKARESRSGSASQTRSGPRHGGHRHGHGDPLSHRPMTVSTSAHPRQPRHARVGQVAHGPYTDALSMGRAIT